jgi:histidyl-tRNA synthetase
MRDLLPDEVRRWRTVEETSRAVLESFGYAEIRLPLVEATELFKRSVGEATDIVGKEMYSFADRDGVSLTLRPEGTAGVVRAGLEHGLLFNQVQRFWYSGSMFRYEKPQKGRYRQFEQIGAEAFGMPGVEVEAELIQAMTQIFARLGVSGGVTLELNTLGTTESRVAYREALVAYLTPRAAELDADSRQRLERNPLRILDSKVASTQALLASAPGFDEYLDAESQARFAELCSLLDALGIAYRINRRLVRGLDYYTHTVFEWVTDALGAQGTVCAGGRYDGLVGQLGGKPTPGVGFAFGVDRLVHLCETLDGNAGAARSVDVYCIVTERAASAFALAFAQRIRDRGLIVRTQMQSGKFDAEMKRAQASGAALAMIVAGADEPVRLKWLDGRGADERLSVDTAVERAVAQLN